MTTSWGNTSEKIRFDGIKAFEQAITANVYKSIEDAVAQLTVFTHPETVVGVFKNANVFNAIRAKGENKRESFNDNDKVMYDDNHPAHCAFVYANGLQGKDYSEVQFNHLYVLSDRKAHYTSLANIVMTPAFLAKLTDTHKNIPTLLRYRSYKLYGYDPLNQFQEDSTPPEGYDKLKWAEPLAPLDNVEESMRTRIYGNRKKQYNNRLTRSIARVGWYFPTN
jgi:hypothetical protein